MIENKILPKKRVGINNNGGILKGNLDNKLAYTPRKNGWKRYIPKEYLLMKTKNLGIFESFVER